MINLLKILQAMTMNFITLIIHNKKNMFMKKYNL